MRDSTLKEHLREFLSDLVDSISANGEYNTRTAPISMGSIRENAADFIRRIDSEVSKKRTR